MIKIKKMHLLDGLFILVFVFIMMEITSFEPKKENRKLPQLENKNIPDKVFDFTFIDWPNVRQVNNEQLGTVLSDIESHLPFGHAYSHQDLITWGHEATHGINANIRNSQAEPWLVNGFYCLKNSAVVLFEPKTTITKVAPRIPQILRGPSYDLYLKKQTKYWNDRPLYIVDEWVAYTNGVEVGLEMESQGWDYELLQAHNFSVYAIHLAMEIQVNCPDYDDASFSGFVKWNIERVMSLTEQARNKQGSGLKKTDEYLAKIRTGPESEQFRQFCRGYFGNEWCETTYDF